MARYKNEGDESVHVVLGENRAGITQHDNVEPGETVELTRPDYAERLGLTAVHEEQGESEDTGVDLEAEPTTRWTKSDIKDWLDAHEADYEESQNRSGLLATAKEFYVENVEVSGEEQE